MAQLQCLNFIYCYTLYMLEDIFSVENEIPMLIPQLFVTPLFIVTIPNQVHSHTSLGYQDHQDFPKDLHRTGSLSTFAATRNGL
jgi:hypothetical protein